MLLWGSSIKAKKSDGEKQTPTHYLRNIGCQTIPTTVMKLIKTDDFWSKIELEDMCGKNHTSGIT